MLEFLWTKRISSLANRLNYKVIACDPYVVYAVVQSQRLASVIPVFGAVACARLMIPHHFIITVI